DALLQWCKDSTQGYKGVEITNFTTSWTDGVAYLALVHRFKPSLLDFSAVTNKDKHANYKQAFKLAEDHLGVPAFIDADDLAQLPFVDRQSNVCYLAEFY
ncbi:hypothetical protein DICPUDRAFT_13370, partial [Dictyostelium purpureum]